MGRNELGFDGEFDLSASKVPLKHAGKKNTCEKGKLILDSVSSEALKNLLEPSAAYAKWLRVVLLRMLLDSSALTERGNRQNFNLLKVTEFLGFKDYEKFSEEKTAQQIRSELNQLLQKWIEKGYGIKKLPKNLEKNLESLRSVIPLTNREVDILAFAILLHSESIVETGCDLLGSDVACHKVPRILAAALADDIDGIRASLNRESRLARTGLLSLELRGRYGLRELVDLMTATFANRMLGKLGDIRSLVENFVSPSSHATLAPEKFSYAQEWIFLVKRHLEEALETQKGGINILIYGRPGSGKTEFARMLAKELNVQMLEIKVMSADGSPIAPLRRLRNQRVSQSFFSETRSILLFDECEEIFDNGVSNDYVDDESNTPRKSWLNMSLESNRLPTIWISNSIKHFEEAYLRRFSICFEMPLPKKKDALRIVDEIFSDQIGGDMKKVLASHGGIAPAIMSQVAGVVNGLFTSEGQKDREQSTITLLNEKLKAQSIKRVDWKGCSQDEVVFDPAFIECEVDLNKVLSGLRKTQLGRLCIYGPPGTGKTAFGHWVAEELGKPHLAYKASDLFGSYLGETEKNIASAFNAAKEQEAVLQFDEVDSFLQDRSKAMRSWEVSQVNEMLTQMEHFNGIFIASTNLFEDLDDASLRRFDMTLKFHFLKAKPAAVLFIKTCQAVGVDASEDSLLELSRLNGLTPGDFAQLRRAHTIEGMTSAAELITRLKTFLSVKKTARGKDIGFLRAAA